MTQETFRKAIDLNHDIETLMRIQSELAENRWVGFRSKEEDFDPFYLPENLRAFEQFIAAQIEKDEQILAEL